MDQLSLKELNELVRATLDTHLEPSYWVVAEIGEMRLNQRGHCYMELIQKEEEELVAKIRANIWAYTYRNLSGWFEATTGQSLKPGLKILVNAMVQFHELYGMSLIIRDIDPNFTLGDRARKRQEIINRLQTEGFLNKNKSLPLPLVPQNIAIISSPTAAGFGDFKEQLRYNPYGYVFRITLFKSLMQGEEAIESIIMAFDRILESKEDFDLVVVIRGGGSQVDLDCFDSYRMCVKLAEMPIPVLTGIGHERDETIADLVAHTSLKTPTAVSEFLINGIGQFDLTLDELMNRIRSSFSQKIRMEELKLQEYKHLLLQSFYFGLRNMRHNLENQRNRLISAVNSDITSKHQNLENLSTKLQLLDPEQVLKRGYTITSVKNKFLSKAEKVKIGDMIRTYSKSLIIDSKIEKSQSRK